MYAALMERAAEDLRDGAARVRPMTEVLAGHEDDPGPNALALRLFGAVHRLVLEGAAPDLGRFYPSAGGSVDIERELDPLWSGFLAAVEAHPEECRAALDAPPQTNEVGRSAALVVGFLQAAAPVGGGTPARRTSRHAAREGGGMPLRILEIGASAGLNLRWDHFAYAVPVAYAVPDGAGLGMRSRGGPAPPGAFGPGDSPVRFPTSWYPEGIGALVGAGERPTLPEVVDRRGCDLAPLDIATDEGRRILSSYVWPDQTERFARLQGAFEVAARVPAVVDRAEATEWLRRQLAEPVAGCCTVVYHSIFLQYLPSVGATAELAAIIGAAGDRATPEAPLAWLRMEAPGVLPGGVPRSDEDRKRWPGGKTEIRLTRWPGNEETLLADSGFHGSPVVRPG